MINSLYLAKKVNLLQTGYQKGLLISLVFSHHLLSAMCFIRLSAINGYCWSVVSNWRLVAKVLTDLLACMH